MSKKLLLAALLPLLATVAVLAAFQLRHDTVSAQPGIELGADADPNGNSSTKVGTVQECVSVTSGDTFDFDVYVSNVDQLIAWELYLKFDPAIVDVVGVDLWQFLASARGSNLFTSWDQLSRGRHFIGAADTSAPETGSGVLARLTLEAKQPGVSAVTFLHEDRNGDGAYDLGIRLTGEGGVAIGDVTGDDVYDGQPQNAFIAVDDSCDAAPPVPPPAPPPDPSPEPGEGPPPSDSTPPPPEDLDDELQRVFGIDPDEPAEGGSDGDVSSSDDDEPASGDPEGDTPDPSSDPDDEDPPPVVLREGQEPAPDAPSSDPSSSQDGESGSEAGGVTARPSSSSDGGFPLWAVGAIAAAVLVGAAGISVYLAARSGGR